MNPCLPVLLQFSHDLFLQLKSFLGRAMQSTSTQQIRNFPFILLCAIAMSLGWGLRGTIGGGPVGAMIPGVMIPLAIALGLNLKRDLSVLLVFGAVAIGLGGQMTYGQTIGFTKTGPIWWGIWAMTLKGAVWGLTGGILLGLGFMRRRYRTEELLWGFLILLALTICGRQLLDAPKIYYLSNRWDKPREEVWMGLLLGGVSLQAYLLLLKRETVSLTFAFWGMLCGAIGFGGGGLFFPLEAWIDQHISAQSAWKVLREIPAWKSMEYFFGLMLGIGYAIAALSKKTEIIGEESLSISPQAADAWDGLPVPIRWLLAMFIPLFGLWLHFTVDFHPMFSMTGTLLLVAALGSTHAAWHIALSMTIVAFIRDHAYLVAEKQDFSLEYGGWPLVFLISIPVVILIEILPKNSPRITLLSLLLVGWLGTLTALDKLAVLDHFGPSFVVHVFLNETVLMSLLAYLFYRRNSRFTPLSSANTP